MVTKKKMERRREREKKSYSALLSVFFLSFHGTLLSHSCPFNPLRPLFKWPRVMLPIITWSLFLQLWAQFQLLRSEHRESRGWTVGGNAAERHKGSRKQEEEEERIERGGREQGRGQTEIRGGGTQDTVCTFYNLGWQGDNWGVASVAGPKRICQILSHVMLIQIIFKKCCTVTLTFDL